MSNTAPSSADLARITARSMRRSDLMSEAWEGVARAEAAYDPDRGVPWEKFAILCARRRVLDVVRREANRPRPAYLEETIVPDDHYDCRPEVLEDILITWLRRHHDNAKLVTCAVERWVHDVPTKDIAAELGVSPSQVRNYLCTARRTVREVCYS